MKNLLLSLTLAVLFLVRAGGVSETPKLPLAPSFTQHVLPIIKGKCSHLPTCHAAKGASTPFVDHASISIKAKTIVKRITNVNGIMPPIQAGVKLSKAEINQIKIWTENGAPNN